MPYIRIQTNQDAADGPALLARLSAEAAKALGKPESYVQTVLEDGRTMTFGGSDGPTAYVECKSIGLVDSRTAALSRMLTDVIAEALSIPGDRIYIEFAGAVGSMWGWNGGTF